MSECDVNVGLAIEQLEEAKTIDDKARALIARYDAACPTMAKVRADRAKGEVLRAKVLALKAKYKT